MRRVDWVVKATFVIIALLLGVIAVRPVVVPDVRVAADTNRFDYVYIVSPLFLYKGQQGLLVMDRRNANVWFFPRSTQESNAPLYQDPVFVTRLPFDKLDQIPQ